MKVKDVMHKGVDWVSPDTPVSELAKLMREHDIGAIPIGENDRPLKPAAIIRGRLAPPRIEACLHGRGSGLRSGRGQIGKRLLASRCHRPDAQ
jgi:CBS domain-containing protein